MVVACRAHELETIFLGGIAFILDDPDIDAESSTAPVPAFEKRLNSAIVSAQRVSSAGGEKKLRSIITEHVRKTGSVRGQSILDNWEAMLPKFWQVVPPSEANSPYVVDATEAEAQGQTSTNSTLAGARA